MAGVSTATGFAANVLSNVLSRLWNKVVEEVKMVVFLPRAVTQMKKEVQTLDDAIQDINAELDQEQRRPKRIVKTWLDTADELKKKFGVYWQQVRELPATQKPPRLLSSVPLPL